jgi:hypothetical protein
MLRGCKSDMEMNLEELKKVFETFDETTNLVNFENCYHYIPLEDAKGAA